MSAAQKPHAARGDLSTFSRERFAHEDFAHEVFRKGTGPAVLVLTEIPCISPYVLGFADRVAALGCTAVLPDLFGEAGHDPWSGPPAREILSGLAVTARLCVSREFTLFATGRSSPVVSYLRALGQREHARCGGPGIGAVGMCFTGGFALALAADPHVLVPVLSQPGLPFGPLRGQRRNIDVSPAQLDAVKRRCAGEGLRVLGLRFEDDPLVPAERFQFLRETLGDGFVAVELPQSAGHPGSPHRRHHSVLTTDLIDAPGEPTRAALDQVLGMLEAKLLRA
jgi:dienelactone hydrolase